MDPTEASVGLICDFFLSLFDRNLSLATIRGYRSAIGSIHKGFPDGSVVSNAGVLSKLFRAFFLKRPPSKRLLPSWSLPRVLQALAAPPFEPLGKASLLNLSIKTCFLIAVASGQRRSAIHALTTASGHIRWESSAVRLIPEASYIAKNQTANSKPCELLIPRIQSFSSEDEDKLWCPVRALKWYLDRTKDIRCGPNLFISSRPPHSPVSRDTISRWLVLAIRSAGDEVLLQGPIRAHDTRGVAASWALFNGASLNDILTAAYWASPNTFISCYLKDVLAAEPSFGGASLRAAKHP